MRTLLYCTLLFIFIMSTLAKSDDGIEVTDEDIVTGLQLSPAKEPVDYNKSNNAENGFSSHKSNYVLPVTFADYTEGRKREEIKFQISIKQRLVRFYGWAAYFGYTQKSFWQAYSFSDSQPFRENNFNPEIFIRTKMWIGIRFDLGLEHESNGQKVPESRGWNRIYFTPYFENDYFICSAKGWYRIKEKRKKKETDGIGDDNPDIIHYYGYGELGLTAKFISLWNIWLSGIFRYNPKWDKGSAEINFTIPISTKSVKGMIQYWEGYGESLIDYNIRQRKIGFGLCFTR